MPMYRGFMSDTGQNIFLFSTASGLTLGFTQPTVHWIPEFYARQHCRRVAKLTPLTPSSRDEEYVGPTTIPYMGCLINHSDNFLSLYQFRFYL
jgi:hypothetical protein